MMVYCNIGSPDDVAAVLANDGRGIGLFRSEFLYLAASDYPSEEQFKAYKTVAAAMNGKRVEYFQMQKEENPAMGVRAIRICLNRPEVFRTQLRALYRASAFGKVAIMFPMITSVWEVKECKRACQKVMAELDEEGIPYNKDGQIWNEQFPPVMEEGAILVHGHFHIPACVSHGIWLYVNPGSVSLPRMGSPRSYVVLCGKTFILKCLDGVTSDAEDPFPALNSCIAEP